MGILSGPVFGTEQLLQLICPMVFGGVVVLGVVCVWFALGAFITGK